MELVHVQRGCMDCLSALLCRGLGDGAPAAQLGEEDVAAFVARELSQLLPLALRWLCEPPQAGAPPRGFRLLAWPRRRAVQSSLWRIFCTATTSSIRRVCSRLRRCRSRRFNRRPARAPTMS